jgi:flagellar biosynthesis protein FliR
MQRLMPQIQLFLIILPAQIWGGFFVFFMTLAAIMTVWLQVFDDIAGRMFIR